MNWTTIRKFIAAWIGMMIGHVCAGGGTLHRVGSLQLLVDKIHADVSMMFLALVMLLGLSAIHATAVIFGYYEKDQEMRRLRRVVRPRNYFLSGLGATIPPWLLIGAFSGSPVDLSQLFG